MKFLVGKKLKMTRVFDKDGAVVPVTAIELKPTEVFEIKTREKSGYDAIKVAITDRKKTKMAEFRADSAAISEFKVGQKLDLSFFAAGDQVRVVGRSKGKGFAGAIKRHGFSRGPETHGSDHHRRVGSIGSMFPQHVLRGQKMPGRLGGEKVTVRNLKVIDVIPDKQIILVSGAIPGPAGSEVRIVGEAGK